MRCEADPRGSVDREPDVAGVRERRAPAVQPDPQPDVGPPGPGVGAHRSLDRERRFERGGGLLEDGEVIVPAHVDLATVGIPNRGAHPTTDIGEQGAY